MHINYMSMEDASIPDPVLCTHCGALDVRALYRAAKDDRSAGWIRFVDQLDGIDTNNKDLVFQHHDDLLHLKKSAGECSLCAEIWTAFCYSAGISNEIFDRISRVSVCEVR